MRARLILAVLLGTLLGLLNHIGVIAGILGPPPGYQPAYYLRNLDVPQYLAWMELARTHWLLPNGHAPWQTEPALFQPMFTLAGRIGLPTIVSYYGLQLLMYWVAAYALILAAQTFMKTRRAMLYSAVVVLGALPLRMLAWTAAKALGWPAMLQLVLGYGLVEYGYDTADGLARGGLSNSMLLSFGTAMMLFAFTNLVKFITDGRRRHYYWLLGCVFLDGLFHPFEIFVITIAAVWPLWKAGRKKECFWLFVAAGAGMLPYVIETVRFSWVRRPLADGVAMENGFTRLGSAGLRHTRDADLLADADPLPGRAARRRNPAELVSVRGGVADDSRDDERDPHLRRICVRGWLSAGKEGTIRPTDLAALSREAASRCAWRWPAGGRFPCWRSEEGTCNFGRTANPRTRSFFPP